MNPLKRKRSGVRGTTQTPISHEHLSSEDFVQLPLQDALTQTSVDARALCAKAVADINSQELIGICRSFIQQHSIFAFLHKPSFFERLNRGEVSPIKLCAIMALSDSPISPTDASHPDTSRTTSYYAEIAKSAAMASVDEVPDIELAQTLIILSLRYWGQCQSFRAWTLIGEP